MSLSAQSLWNILLDDSLNYFNKTDAVEQFIEDAGARGDSIDQAALKRYERWHMFWGNRVDTEGEYPAGARLQRVQ